jgi:flavin reductase (DIM6/NTAB) family NADH-FMN oxidoreductase RutF
MGRFPSGVTIVTCMSDSVPVGTTVNAFTSVSLEPPLLLVCLVHENPALAPIERCGLFGVNFLAAEHHGLARQFGRESATDPFDGVSYVIQDGGAPQLQAACLFVQCALEQSHAAGDHKILVGRGLRIDHASTAAPLLYHKGSFPNPIDPKAWA